MFRITSHKGFQMVFANGCTVSVQFGPGNYCEHHNVGIGSVHALLAPERAEQWESEQAEVAAWDAEGKWHDFGNDQVKGYMSPDDVMDFMRMIQTEGVTKKFEMPTD